MAVMRCLILGIEILYLLNLKSSPLTLKGCSTYPIDGAISSGLHVGYYYYYKYITLHALVNNLVITIMNEPEIFVTRRRMIQVLRNI